MNVLMYLVAQNVHGPRFTTPFLKSTIFTEAKRCLEAPIIFGANLIEIVISISVKIYIETEPSTLDRNWMTE